MPTIGSLLLVCYTCASSLHACSQAAFISASFKKNWFLIRNPFCQLKLRQENSASDEFRPAPDSGEGPVTIAETHHLSASFFSFTEYGIVAVKPSKLIAWFGWSA